MEENAITADDLAAGAQYGGWLDSLAGTGRIIGDIVSPVVEEADWDALRD
jgi:hypothetical protein